MEIPRLLVTTTVSFLLTLPAWAVIETWDGGGADDKLSTPLNWVDNTAPLSDLVNTDFIFDGIARLTPNFAVPFSANNLTFNNNAAANAFTLGGALTIGTGGIVNNDANGQIFTSAGAITIFYGAQSGAGNFTGTGTVYSIGDLRPGNSPGSVWHEGDLVFGGASSLTLETDGLVSGSEHDHLDLAGALSADSALTLALLDGFTPQLGETFDLLDVGTFAGDFDSISAPALAGGKAWNFSALKTTGSVVPEPGSAAMLALLDVGLLGMRRKC